MNNRRISFVCEEVGAVCGVLQSLFGPFCFRYFGTLGLCHILPSRPRLLLLRL